MKKILVINGHPNKASFNYGLSEAYKKGAEKSGNKIKEIFVGELEFNPNLQFGYQKRTELEPDLLEAWEDIKWAEHIVWIYPLWWGFMPTILKGFIDRLFLPNFAFQYKENSTQWDKLLKGKTAHIVNTMDYPVWYYKWFLRARGTKIMKNMILNFVGIKTIKTTYIAPIKNSNLEFREKWINKVETLGQKMK
jgi:putative NADPH-quinone reductase